MGSLIEDYQRSKNIYARSKNVRAYGQDPSNNGAPETNEVSHFSKSSPLHLNSTPHPPLPPKLVENKIACNAQEEKLIQQIRVVGLRPTREKVLIESLGSATEAYKDRIQDLSSCLDQWTAYAKELEVTSVNALQEMELELSEQIDCKQKYEDALEESKREQEVLRKELKIAKSKEEQLDQKNKEEMNRFLDEMEIKVESVKSQMKKEMSATKCAMKDEFEQKLKDINHTFETQRQEHNESARAQEIKYNTRLESLERDMEDKDFSLKNLNSLLKEKDLRIHLLENELEEIKFEVDSNKAKNSKELRKVKEEREEELENIEARVKQIIRLKDKQLQDSLLQAKNAEEKAQEFEQCMLKLESGL